MIRLQRPAALVCIFIAGFCCPRLGFSLEKEWTRSLAGETLAGPIGFAGRVYVAGSDRSVTCLSEDGRFLWIRNIPGRSAPLLTVTAEGTVYAVTEPGIITALSADGSLLWQLRGQSLPLFSPYEGRDGRFFLIYSNRVVCVSPLGAVKWTLSIKNRPYLKPSETGDGDLLVATADRYILRISPFGELLEQTEFPENVTCLTAIPGGYAAGYSSGLIQGFDVRGDTELLWRYSSNSACVSLASGGGTLFSVHSDGALNGLNVTDGSILWQADAGYPASGPVFISYEYDQFNLAYRGHASARTASGILSWYNTLDKNLVSPIISPSGTVFASAPGWLLYGYRAESRIINEKNFRSRDYYSILEGETGESGFNFISDTMQLQAFFSRVSDDISRGTVGTSEIFFARRLTDILENKTGNAVFGRTFDAVERGRAASLLGQLCSAEYRSVLAAQAYGDFDESLAIGILYGISALGYDRNGESLAAVGHLVRQAGFTRPNVLYAACDALYALIRYSAGKTALDGTAMLLSFIQDPYSDQVRLFARKRLENILH